MLILLSVFNVFDKKAVLVSTLTGRAVPPEIVILLSVFNVFRRNH